VFLDRDGVINRLRKDDYVKCWEEFEFLPDAQEALRLLADAYLRVIVVTNQRGVALGLLSERELAAVHDRMLDEIEQSGGHVSAVYYCPHEIGACDCRKPDIGLFLEAQRDFSDIDFSQSFVIGDSASDLAAGARLGCATVLIGTSDLIPSARGLRVAVDTFVLPALPPARR
jgi:D-glycero-D-manno-heptose 1,7-bisphosphate phosphatase